MSNPILDIEQAIIKQIKSATDSGALGYKIPVIDSYCGEGDDNIPHLLKTCSPAVWVTFGGETGASDKYGKRSTEVFFNVIVYVRNNTSEKASREGSKNFTGAYQLLCDIQRLLIKQTLNLPIAPLEFVETKVITNAVLEKFYTTIYGLRFKTVYSLNAWQQAEYDKLDEFLEVGSDWNNQDNHSTLNFNVRSEKIL